MGEKSEKLVKGVKKTIVAGLLVTSGYMMGKLDSYLTRYHSPGLVQFEETRVFQNNGFTWVDKKTYLNQFQQKTLVAPNPYKGKTVTPEKKDQNYRVEK